MYPHYTEYVRDWIPVPGSSKERLINSALDLFSARGYEAVSVQDIAERAGVTTGSLYHHFGGKPQLHALVRTDVERRVADRVEAVLESDGSIDAALLTGFDWLVRSGFAGLIGAGSADTPSEGELDRVVANAVGEHRALVALAAWRAALTGAASSPAAAPLLRSALAELIAPRD